MKLLLMKNLNLPNKCSGWANQLTGSCEHYALSNSSSNKQRSFENSCLPLFYTPIYLPTTDFNFNYIVMVRIEFSPLTLINIRRQNRSSMKKKKQHEPSLHLKEQRFLDQQSSRLTMLKTRPTISMK